MRNDFFSRLLEKVDNLDHPTLVAMVKKFYKQRNFFETIISLVRDGVIWLGEKGHILFINKSAMEVLGIRASHGENLWRCCPELAKGIDVSRIFDSAISTEIEISYPSFKNLKFYSVPFQDQNDRFSVCVLTDITQELSSKKKQIEVEKINSILLLSAGIAHEIGNPLNSISLQLELLEALVGEKNAEGALESIKNCKQEVTRLHGIIKNFLQAVRPVPLNLVDTDLLELIRFVIKFLKPELDNAEIEVKISVKNEISVVWADSDQMKQVFFNIVKNAIEAMPVKGRLTITLSSDDDYIFIQFEDEGYGIEAENLGQIFDPFVTSKADGNGLGMFIVHRILRNHGATISVASKIDSGTTVTIRFPQKLRKSRMLNDYQAD